MTFCVVFPAFALRLGVILLMLSNIKVSFIRHICVLLYTLPAGIVATRKASKQPTSPQSESADFS